MFSLLECAVTEAKDVRRLKNALMMLRYSSALANMMETGKWKMEDGMQMMCPVLCVQERRAEVSLVGVDSLHFWFT
jgi:hypothetical protein